MWTTQIVEDMWRACMIDFKGSWEDYLHLEEFSYNNSYQVNIKMALFKALYDRNQCCVGMKLVKDDIWDRKL